MHFINKKLKFIDRTQQFLNKFTIYYTMLNSRNQIYLYQQQQNLLYSLYKFEQLQNIYIMSSNEQMQQICTYLLNDSQFISAFSNKIHKGSNKQSYTQQLLDEIIEQISNFLEQLIQQKMRLQMNQLIQDNNKILEQIKFSIEKGHQRQSKIIEGSSQFDTSFTDIHNMINQERMKAFDRMNDAELQKSLSIMERYEDVVDKVKEIQKKVKGLEDRYETNFKSLWNVLSMTEAVVFDHIKENKQSKAQINRKQPTKDIIKDSTSFISSFWK